MKIEETCVFVEKSLERVKKQWRHFEQLDDKCLYCTLLGTLPPRVTILLVIFSHLKFSRCA